MARSKLKILAIIFAAVAVLAIGGLIFHEYQINTSTAIAPFQVENPAATKKVYIAMDNSAWKLATVQAIIESLKDIASFKVDNLPTLAQLNEAEWDAILIVAPVYMSSLQNDAAKFSSKSATKQKIVLLSTSGKVEIKLEGIDTLTAASGDATDTIAQVSAKLKKILSF